MREFYDAIIRNAEENGVPRKDVDKALIYGSAVSALTGVAYGYLGFRLIKGAFKLLIK